MIECNINSNFPFNLLVIIALLTIHTNNSVLQPPVGWGAWGIRLQDQGLWENQKQELIRFEQRDMDGMVNYVVGGRCSS